MKRHPWKFALVLLVPFALFAFIVERNSWRPKTFVLDGYAPYNLKFSPDSRYLAITNETFQTMERQVQLFDLKLQRITHELKHASNPLFLDENHLVITREGAEIYQIDSRKIAATTQPYFWHIGFSQKAGLVGYLWNTEHVSKFFLWDWRSKQPPKQCLELKPQEKTTLGSNWHLMKETLIDENRNFVDFTTGKLRFRVKEHGKDRSGYVSGFSHHNGFSALYNVDRVEIWNCHAGQLQNSFSTPMLGTVELSQDATLLAGSDGGQKAIGLWDTSTGDLLRHIPDPEGASSFAFSPDNHILAVASDDGQVSTIKLWRIK